MDFLKRAISKGVSDAVGDAVRKAVEPTATDLANKAADAINEATAGASAQTAQTAQTTTTQRSESGLEGALGNLQRSVEGYATEAAKNSKICPSCEAVCSADKKFCPSCGAKLPETTLADGTKCPNCGKQNSVGTKFCDECGTKLPAAVAEEEAAAARAAAEMARWDTMLANYPRWNCGGGEVTIEEYDGGYIMFAVDFAGEVNAAHVAVRQYRDVLKADGFRAAGEYPSDDHLYKMVGSSCYHVDLEHCFDGDPDSPCIYFNIGEPTGGFNYVKPEPKKRGGFFGLFD